MARRDLLSIITPAFNEEENIETLFKRLKDVLDPTDLNWEWIIIDDHSVDDTYKNAKFLAEKNTNIKVIRLAQNSGSHTALTCGLHHSNGDAAVLLACDLQDPPEVIPNLIAEWLNGTQVVSAARNKRKGEKASTLIFSKLFYWLLRRVGGLKWIHETGSDFMLIDRRVIEAFKHHNERNVHIFVLLTWMGFRQKTIFYDKEARLSGSTGWTISKKIKLALDTLIPFSYMPIRVMSVIGLMFSLSGFIYALFIIFYIAPSTKVEGWSSLMVLMLMMGGFIMLMLGILGEYLWRTYEESRKRPPFLIEDLFHHQEHEASIQQRNSDKSH